MSVEHHESFGWIPSWCYSRPMRLFHFVVSMGMLFGLFVVFPERFLFIGSLKAKLPDSMYFVGVIWLIFGALFYSLWFLGLAIFDRHYEKKHHK